MVFHPFGFVRGKDAWLHADTLLTAGRPLNMRDVSVLASCVVPDFEGGVAPSQAAVSIHTNNGGVDGWVPLLPYLFEPIFFINNEPKENLSHVRCYPKKKTTKDRVTYLSPAERMSLDDTERAIEAYFPGVSITYVKALIIAMGCAESGQGDIPILWATGPTEAAKTTTARIVMEMYGEGFHSMSEVPEDRLDQIFGETLEKTRLIMFDDFAKETENYKRFHTFVIRMNRSGHTYHKLHYGERTTAINNAVILTDWRVPGFFSHDLQFARRVHLIRLTNRLQKSWSAMGHFVEGWWQTNSELTKAANSLHSWMIDEFFPEGDREPFSVKMTKLGIQKLEDEIGQDEVKDALRDIVRTLVTAIGEAPAQPLDIQKRLGAGVQLVPWNEGSPVGGPCVLLCDSLGSDRRTSDDLRHVLDPFQLELPKMFVFADGVGSVEFDLKAWGKNLYIRLVESGRSNRSKTRRINRELFSTWPPTRVKEAEPLSPVAEALIAQEKDDNMPVVVLGLPEDGPPTPFTVYLDFETQSECELKKHGSYVYAEHPSTKVVCAALEIGQRRIFWTEKQHNLILPAGVEYEHGVDFLRAMVTDPGGCTIVAHNMEFERAMWTRCLKLPEPVQWYDTMDLTLARGLPAGADAAGGYLLGMRKDSEGYSHMMHTCKPQKEKGRNGKWFMPPIDDLCVQKMIDYNFRDVDISRGIAARFGLRMQPEWEQRVCDLHHDINFWGIRIDKSFCETLKQFDDEFKVVAGEMVERITGGEIKRTDLTRTEFLQDAINQQLPPHLRIRAMKADGLERLIDAYNDHDNPNRDLLSPEVIQVMQARLMVSRAALAKVDKALDCISADGRAKAQFRYWAAHTGRFGGTYIQPQNMKRPDEDFDIPAAIQAIEAKDREKFRELCIGKPPYELLSSLVRGMFIPEEGHVFVSADFSSIEARVLMWLAGDEQGLEEHRDADRGGLDVYCKLATTLYGRTITKKDKTERQAGKIGQLACGYQGSVGAVDRFATTYGLDFAAAGITPMQVVEAFRNRYPKVKTLWYACEGAFRQVLNSRRSKRPGRNQRAEAAKCVFEAHDDRVEIQLPSGRILTYMNARLEHDENSFHDSKTTIYYDTAVKGQVVSHSIYGGLICENIDQAIARDLLVLAMLTIADAGYPIPLHVHDELLCEVPTAQGEACAAFVKLTMETPPEWGKGIPLHAEPSVIHRYGK
jgi:DNA polymerase